MSRRIEKLTRTIRDIVSDTIQNHLSDPRILALTSVTRVELAPDLSLAKIYLSMFDPAGTKRDLCLQAINNATGFVRTRLAGSLKTRICPALVFYHDESIQKGREIERLLDQIAQEQTVDQPPSVTPAENSDEK